jgi:hypothetical protein
MEQQPPHRPFSGSDSSLEPHCTAVQTMMEQMLIRIQQIDTRIDTLSVYVRTLVDTCRGPLHKPSLEPIKKAVRSSPRFKK